MALLTAVVAAAGAGRALVVQMPLEKSDAIISLASHEWERLPEVARQAHANRDAKVLLTIPPEVSVFSCHDCPNRVARLRALGVDPSRVHELKPTSQGTYGEALSALAFAKANDIKRLLVVTSPYHTRRSLAAFRKVFAGSGIEVGVQPAVVSSAAHPEAWWWYGDDRAYVPYEWAALVYYALRYGVDPVRLH